MVTENISFSIIAGLGPYTRQSTDTAGNGTSRRLIIESKVLEKGGREELATSGEVGLRAVVW